MVSIPDGSGRKAVIEQTGLVRIIDARGRLLPEPFLNIQSKLVHLEPFFDEQGLLGIAFHPNYRTNGKFYIAYSQPLRGDAPLDRKLWWAHTNVVAEMTVSKDNPNKANPSAEKIIHSLDWPQFNHNGHWIEFGPDGKLYVSTGDGGYANDWGIGHNVTIGNGQDMKSHARQDPAPRRRQGRLHPGRQPVRRTRRPRAADLGVRTAQSVALLVRHGGHARAVLRRRAAGLL